MSRLEVQQQGGGKSARRTVWHIQYERGLTNTSSFIGKFTPLGQNVWKALKIRVHKLNLRSIKEL